VSDLPRLAIFHNEHFVSLFDLVEASRDLCRIVWVTGWSAGESPLRALSRFGDVVDVSGMSEDESVAHLVALRSDGVAVFNDAPIRLAAMVAEELGLVFHSARTAALLTDKIAQRTALGEAGLPVPQFAAIQSKPGDVRVPFPAVLKPRAGAGSRDTFMVRNDDELADALAKCDGDEAFILEEWLPDRTEQSIVGADVVSVESVVRGGAIEHIIVTGRFPFAPPFRETGSFMPSDLNPADWDGTTALAGAAARALDIQNAILHTEIKFTPAGPRVVEVNGRLGGGISHLLSQLGGPSLFEWVMKLALGHDVGPVPEISRTPVAFFRFLVAPQSATALESVSGVKELKALAGVDGVTLNLQPGDPVYYQHSSFVENAMVITGMVQSHAELSSLINNEIESTVALTWKRD
jgi:biotin carboxylase